MAWLEDLAPAARLVAVAHGALGRAIRCAYLNLPAAAMLELDEPQDAIFRLCCGRIERIEVL
jgi:broad specificity phosphatase PhoE